MRARRLPVGHARNDLRQLAIGLLWLDRNGLDAATKDRTAALLEMNEAREERQCFCEARVRARSEMPGLVSGHLICHANAMAIDHFPTLPACKQQDQNDNER
jgi:hypothetical protein